MTVVEADPIRGVIAQLAGHNLDRFAQALLGLRWYLSPMMAHIWGWSISNTFQWGLYLCAAGADITISPAIVVSGSDLRPVRAHVTAFDLPRARGLKLVAEGRSLHLSDGQGLPLEVKDIVLALHILALDQLMRVSPSDPALQRLDPVAETGLAAMLVTASGGSLEA